MLVGHVPGREQRLWLVVILIFTAGSQRPAGFLKDDLYFGEIKARCQDLLPLRSGPRYNTFFLKTFVHLKEKKKTT